MHGVWQWTVCSAVSRPPIQQSASIVCAVDGERLKSAIATKYEGVEMLDTKDKTTAASQLAREQIDKLFISGIKLC